MLIVRGVRPASRSGRVSAGPSMSASWYEPTLRASPPPRSCHAPTSAGSTAIVR